MTFREWLDMTYYPDFDPSGLDDASFAELEDAYEEDELGFMLDCEEDEEC